MAVTNSYATVAQLRTHFGDSGSTLTTELLERALDSTSRAIDKVCGRRFWIDPSVQTLTFDPEFTDLAFVDDIATTTGLVVKTDSAADGTYATTWTIGTDFRLGPRNSDKHGPTYAWTRLEVIGTKAFPVGQTIDALQVTAKFGWSEIPDEVEQACLIRAAAIFKRKESIEGFRGFDALGVVSITRRDADVWSLLYPFMRLGVGAA